MAYYAAVISLKHTIQRLLNSSQISILPPSPEILDFLYKEVISLQEVLQRLEKSINSSSSSSSEKVNSLNEEIREAICKIEDALDSHVSSQSLSRSESRGDEGFSLKLSLDLEEVKQEISSLIEKAKKMEDECSKEDPVLSNSSGLSATVPSRIYFGGKKSKMVGLYDEFNKIKDLLTVMASDRPILSLVGMAGIGKSTLAKEVYEDPDIVEHFHLRAWVTVTANYQAREIQLDLLAQMNYDIDEMRMKDDIELAVRLHQSLYGLRYLIVLDDVWNPRLWDTLKILLPDSRHGSRIMLTTRIEEVARSVQWNANPHQKRFLNKEESWHLLREEVFSGQCPPQFEKAGKKIAKICEGLPLTIVTVAALLQSHKCRMTPEYWKEAAEEKNSLFADAYDEMSEILMLSYKYLPLHFKACFLYIGVFPPSCEIPASKLIRLWIAEGFLHPNPSKSLDDIAMECLKDLVSRSVVLFRQQRSSFGIKTCSLHSTFRYLCVRQAWKEKLFHLINSYANSSTRVMESQRRLCIHNNSLFGMKDVHDSVRSVSMAHSILCTGPHHQYPVPICFSLRLLRVLDVLTIRLYKFPIEVLGLVLLRYLALTYNGKLPPSISKLWNLHYLIVRRHLSIKSFEDNSSSYLPVEIWDMKELKHLQFMGGNLPDPRCDVADFLPNLVTISDVSAESCTKGVLERIPNLQKLGIQIEVVPNAGEPLCCFDHLSHLHKLESLKCVVMNPNPRSRVVASITTSLPSGLKKLSLSGFGYPWEDMRMIAQLPNLQVLKLRCYAFQGPAWVMNDGEFEQLRYLLIEDTDLEYWQGDGYCFLLLRRLIIKHCYKLKEISWLFEYSVPTIELVDCPSVVNIVEEMQEYGIDEVSVHCSWDEGELIKS